MSGHIHVFGRKPTIREREKDRERERKGKRPLKVDTFLSAPDLLARHLLVRRDSAVPETPTGQGTPAQIIVRILLHSLAENTKLEKVDCSSKVGHHCSQCYSC